MLVNRLCPQVALIVLSVSSLALAARPNSNARLGGFDSNAVEMFQAVKAGDLDVRLIPKDATRSTILVRNNTNKPLRIRMPAAFAGVPALAQAGNNRNNGGGGGGGGGAQAMGGGMGGGMGGMGGMGMGGMFSVGPARVGKIKVATVCLEHGKKDPNPRIPYEIKPLKEFTTNPQVIELCEMLGRQEIDQLSAQAAAWHLTAGFTWNELARKVKVRHLNGSTELFFSGQHLRRAAVAVSEAMYRSQSKTPSSLDNDEQVLETSYNTITR